VKEFVCEIYLIVVLLVCARRQDSLKSLYMLQLEDVSHFAHITILF
jgi:hypothetical protein